MTDVSRSDSQRSDASRPRVSFNRDVHVKRIGNSGAPRVVGALAADGTGRLHPLAVRRERPTRLSRRDLAKEAQKVLQQADSITCTSTTTGLPPTDNENTKFSTLPVRRNKKQHRPLKQTNSFRENGTSSSSPDRTVVKRPRIVVRSSSDVGKDKEVEVKKVEDKTKFWSLDRLRSRKNKPDQNRIVQGTHSDTEKTPISSILSKKSYNSDTEKRNRKNSDSEASSAKKKQLSPIIEVSPREDYFQGGVGKEDVDAIDGCVVKSNKKSVINNNNNNILLTSPESLPKVPSRSRKGRNTTNESPERVNNNYSKTDKMESQILHSSQTISKPTLTRGLAVDSMVRKLSQDRAGRGPPRVVSPLALVSPTDDRQHNNNLPFSYTEPPFHDDRYTSLLLDKDSQQINSFANEKDGNMPTPSSKAVPSPTDLPTSTALNGDSQNVIYAEVVCNGGGKAGALTKQTVHTSVPLSKVKDDVKKQEQSEPMGSNEYKTEFKTNLGDYSVVDAPRDVSGIYRKEYITETRVVEGRGRADGMDSRRNNYEDENYRRVSPIRRNLLDDFINTESHQGYANKFNDDMIEPVLKPRNDLSSRRDRLESRIESQRKDRLMSSRLNDKSYRSHPNVNDGIVIDNVRKYPSNPRLDSDVTRREFLNSQINYENGLGRDVGIDDKFYGDSFGRSVDNIDKYTAKNDKFTDSGIDINYRGDTSTTFQPVSKLVSEVHRSYHNKYEKKSETGGKMRFNSQPTLTNITKVDVNGHIQPEMSDDDVSDDNQQQYYYNSQQNVDQIKAKRALQSTKLVQDSKRDVIPSSSVLIRHFASPDQNGHTKKDHGDGYLSGKKKREFDERRDLDEDYGKKRDVLLGDIEETRRFLLEERKKNAEERSGDDCRRPEKFQKASGKSGKKKQGTIDKMKALFTRSDTKKKSAKKEGGDVVVVDPLTSRYSEYRGGDVREAGSGVDRSSPPRAPSRVKNTSSQVRTEGSMSRSRRERLATPSPSPSRPPAPLTTSNLTRSNNNNNNSTGSWFKSLDRLTSRKKPKPKIDHNETISENEQVKSFKHQNNNNADRSNKNLRFFGDTDAESIRSGANHHHKPLKPLTTLAEDPSPTRFADSNSQQSSTRPSTVNNGSQQSSTRYVPLRDSNNRRYKSSNKLQVPRRRHHRSAGELATSSAESTTEGDSSQQSQRSVVYLHAATVGDIPGRVPSRNGRRARSREELSSTTGSNLTPQTRTVSRSISVLAPWKPRHYREPMEVHYENDSDLQSVNNRGGKPPKVPTNYKTTSSTLNRIKNNKESSQKSYNSLSRDGRDKENRKSMNSLNRKDNYAASKDSRDGKGSRRDISAQSVESLKSKRSNGLHVSAAELNGNKGYRNGATTLKKEKRDGATQKRTELARSVSMPKDSKVKSGWFRLRKKN